MYNVNTCTIVGRLTRDPELRHTQGGTALCKGSIAWNDRKKVNDKWEDGPVQYLDFVAWNHAANSIEKHVTKGQTVMLNGRVTYSSWDDREGGKRSKIELTVESYAVIPKTEKSGDDDDAERSGGRESSSSGKGKSAQGSTSSKKELTKEELDDIPF